MKRARRNEEDVIGANHAVLRVHRRALDDWQDVALHAFAAHLGAVRALAPGNLVDLVDEDDARLLDALNRRFGDAVHVDQLLLFLVLEVFERLGHLHLALFRPALEQTRHHVLQVDVDFLDRRSRDDLERRKRLLAYVQFHRASVEPAVPELFAQKLSRAILLLARMPGVVVRNRRRQWQQEIEQSVLGVLRRFHANFIEALLADDIHAELDEIADHRFHVAARRSRPR